MISWNGDDRTYFFRGKVIANSSKDPQNLNRVQVWVPQIHGRDIETTRIGTNGSYPWAFCMVLVSDHTPMEGSIVLVGFNGNDYDNPIVFGIFSNDKDHIQNQFENLNSTGGCIKEYSPFYQYTGGTLVTIAASIIFSQEGSYTSVNWNDNGSISIGKIQWHANRAKELLIKIRQENQELFDSICIKHGATSLIQLLSNDVSWKNMNEWSNSCPIGKAIKEILGTDPSKRVQDRQALLDVEGYLREAQRGGITDPGCLIYIADIINQYGSAPGLVNSGINNLDELYAYSLSNGYGKYASRRKRVYDAIKSLQSQGKLNKVSLSTVDGNNENTDNTNNNVPSGDGTPVNLGGIYLWPLDRQFQTITNPYAHRSKYGLHYGIDISVPEGNNIYAIADGIVRDSRYNAGGYGHYIMIYHPQDNIRSVYGHGCAPAFFSPGQTVTAGQIIMRSGNSGKSSGPHLHITMGRGDGTSPWDMGTYSSGLGCSFNPEPYLRR